MKENGLSRPRLGNIELLRILSMLLIVCNHFEGHALAIQGFEWDSPNLYSNWLIRGIGYIGVNLYVLISAYFLCKSTFKTKKLLQLLVEVWFYSIVIYFLFVSTGRVSFSFMGFFKSFFPTLCSQYWFITCYVVLYALSPFYNKLISSLSDNKALLRFVGFLLLVFSVIPNSFFFSEWVHFGGTCGIVWMSVIYFVGAAIRFLTDVEQLRKHRMWLWLGMLVCWVLPLLTKVVIAIATQKMTGSVVGSSLFYMNNSIIIVASSIFTFLAFLSMEIKSPTANRVINYIAPSTLAVYLIHDNTYIRPLVWNYSISAWGGTDGYPSITYVILLTLAIFASCIIIDLIRRWLFKLLDCVFDSSLLNKLYRRVDSFFTV